MDNSSREPIESRRISDQPSLRGSSGTIWIVAGGIFLVVIVGVLAVIIFSGGPAVPTAITTLVIAVVFYLVLLIARFTVRPGRARLWVMAAAMIGMAVASLVGLVLCVGAAAGGA
ncbi:hypothetical protein [Brevibacterium linens]|uniref:Uncharacterized protein n=1 Tax=Brevibacterium linens TaxID=1703 RepID=A0A2H1KDD9_BRELN|nr:hypothetical protein [Brevibacterium linens]SMX97588.1 hypothetical protein BLIN101_03229 [Brevibacterium linens]